jgi:hypothetical protein
MANACIAETIPETNGVPAQYCDAPCNGDYCKDHAHLDEFGIDYDSEEFKGYADYFGDPDAEYDRAVDQEMGM